ncbi:ribosome silencing factor [bacterium]|nr:ribosome silencing factor [bacterium]
MTSDHGTPRKTSTREETLQLATEIARAADSKKAEDVVILDISRTLGVADFFVICTARSRKQVAVVAEACELAARRLGTRGRPLEGEETGWVVADFVDVVLHVFEEEARRFYDLEHLWADSPRIEWAPPPGVAAAPGASKPE